MAFSDESLKAKLATLNETQDSIVSVSQWIQFHRRHADKIASYWLTRLRDSPHPKRLNFLYLVNDIVQNSRARRRDEFPNAFAPLMPEAAQTSYRSATQDLQGKIRRLVDVWKARTVFEAPIIEAIETRLDEVDKARGGGKKTLMGNSLFNSSSSGMPKELEPLEPLQIAVSKAALSVKPTIDTAESEYEKLNNPDTTLPPPPVYAARLSALMRSLATAESSVAESIKARKALIEGLERILETNRTALAEEETTYLDLSSRKTSTEAKKREVEDGIMRGLAAEDSPAQGTPEDHDRVLSAGGLEPERPDFEALTPEAITPIGSPQLNPVQGQPQELQPEFHHTTIPPSIPSTSIPRVRPASITGLNGMSAKRRKTEHEEFVPDLGEMGMGEAGALGDLDDDVNELLRQESAKV